MSAPGNVPGGERREEIRGTVRAIVEPRRGASQAITLAELSVQVRQRLCLYHAEATITRRVKAAVSSLCGELPIASSPHHGYFIAVTADECRAARAFLLHQIAALARRLRAFDRATADRITGQLGLDLDDRGGQP